VGLEVVEEETEVEVEEEEVSIQMLKEDKEV